MLYKGELAWKDSHERFLLAEIEQRQGWTEIAWSEASREAFRLVQQQRAFEAERAAWAAERSSLFARHVQAIVTLTVQAEETKAQLLEKHRVEAEAWSAEEKRLNDRKVFLEEVVEEGLAEGHDHNGRAKFPVLPKSRGLVCVACRRRILGQTEVPNQRPKSAGSRSTGSLQRSTVDACVQDLLAPGTVKLIGERVNGLDETQKLELRSQKQREFADKLKEHGSTSPSPYAVPQTLGSTRPAAGHPLNARAALLRQN